MLGDMPAVRNAAMTLRSQDPAELHRLFRKADDVRRRAVGEEVHLRGLIEITSYCVRSCLYCGLRAPNRHIGRYRMTRDEILRCALEARACGCGTVVLQGGEDPAITPEWMADVIRRIKSDVGLAVTLSLGERSEGEFILWKRAGADRYLLRFETSDRPLLRRLHPPLQEGSPDRIALLRLLQSIGYENGGGIMVGLPGQTCASVARDVKTFAELDLDMIGIGPYIPHPATPLGAATPKAVDDEVGNAHLDACIVLALARLACPDANMPSTTALALSGDDRTHANGLQRGANVVMLTLTPKRYRGSYDIYPGKGGTGDSLKRTIEDLHCLLSSLGRSVATGPGSRLRLRGAARP